MENCPDVLYHYTSVESLAMILSTKTFRLSPLSALDDLQEEKANCSILSSFAGKVKVGNFVHPLKAPALMTTMFSGH